MTAIDTTVRTAFRPYVPLEQVVPHDTFGQTLTCMDRLVRRKEICLLWGPSGSGKTVAGQAAAAIATEDTDIDVVYGQLPHGLHMGELAEWLHRRLFGSAPKGTSGRLFEALEDRLAGRRLLILLDEFQGVGLAGMERIRTVFDNPDVQASLVLIADPRVWKLFGKATQISDRAMRKVRFSYLEGDELHAYVRQLHPMLAGASNRQIVELNKFAKGNLRRWNQICITIGDLIEDGDVAADATIDDKVAARVLVELVGP